MNLQLHLLTAMPPHNVNRDEDGRPKTALFAGALRGRISSQAKKRALRFAPHFPQNQRAMRTREAAVDVYRELVNAKIDPKLAVWAALAVTYALGGGGKAPSEKDAGKFLEIDKKRIEGEMAARGLDQSDAETWVLERMLRSDQGLVISTREHEALRRRVNELITACSEMTAKAEEKVAEWIRDVCQKGLLDKETLDLDMALFGRMVAARPAFNVEAACSVSHAVTTHAFSVEGDYFSAGEELNVLRETGAAITSYAFFGSGVYYQHATLDVDLLRHHLQDHRESSEVPSLARKATELLLDGLVFAQPKGKRHGFASDGAAAWVLAHIGGGPSLNLTAAFLDPVRAGDDGRDLMHASIERLKGFESTLAKAYGIEGARLIFNAWPAARSGNEPSNGEFWEYPKFRGAVLEQVA